MCFTPKVSLSTAIIEFLIAAYIFVKHKNEIFARFLALFIFLLGFYQLTEFMLCTSGKFIWVKIGFMIYTLLPSVGLHFALTYTKNKLNLFLLYLPASIFVIIALLIKDFVLVGECSKVFIVTKTYFFNPTNNLGASLIYSFYYIGYIGIIMGYVLSHINKTRNKKQLILFLFILITTTLTILPPIILILLFPALGYQFPSMYCQSALLFSVFALVGSFIQDKLDHPIKYFFKSLFK